jgi:tripartite-type tricarboxylate transporter receptor subunit TctC
MKVTSVPYKGGAQVITDILGGQIHMAFQNILAALPHVKSGRLRPLGISITERSSLLPGVATISESGLRGYDVSAWNGWVAPAGTPAAIVNKLNAELVRAAKSPDVSKKLLDGGGESVGTTVEQFRAVIAAEVPLWRKVVKEAGIRVE